MKLRTVDGRWYDDDQVDPETGLSVEIEAPVGVGDIRFADPRSVERQALRIECLRIASAMADTHSSGDLVKNADLLFDWTVKS
jgi:hypothetical protein